MGRLEPCLPFDPILQIAHQFSGLIESYGRGSNALGRRLAFRLAWALNWYRASNLEARVGEINVPTLYIWGSQDRAIGETAAMDTARYVSGPYTFEKLEGRSHWLLEEVPDEVSALLLKHIRANFIR